MSNRQVLTKKYHGDGGPPETIFVPDNRYNAGLNMVKPAEITAVAKRGPAVSYTDPYLVHLPQTVQQITKSESTPETRATALIRKSHQVTAFLAILTGASMFMLTEWSFLLWLALASAEWIVAFIILAVIDYRETPAAQARMTANRVLDMMERQQKTVLTDEYGGYVE